MHAPHRSTRVIIENIYPEIDSGRYAVKRVVGERLDVWADIFMDGHDMVAAELAFGSDPKNLTGTAPLLHQNNDRWLGSFDLPEIGTWYYTVHAWPDLYGTWRRDTRKKLEAGQNIELDIGEGVKLIDYLFSRAAGKKKIPDIVQAAITMRDLEERFVAMTSDDVAAAIMAEANRPWLGSYGHNIPVAVDPIRAEYSAWYEMFPRSQGAIGGGSGTFADCTARLPDIKAMGFDVVYFPPIHPIGKMYRKGKNNSLQAAPGEPGSPYAIGAIEGGHKDVHPELGTLEDFQNFVSAAKAHGMEVALDLAVQCAPDHPYIGQFPDWFVFRADGTIKYAENPPKKYQDIVNVNFFSASAPVLWAELKSIVDFWIAQGVTIFRVDNPHTKPFAFWEWLIGGIRETHPDVIFLAEAFTRPKVMHQLAKLGFQQSYSYFTWRNTKQELITYLTELTADEPKDFFRPNFFPVTPDIFPTILHNAGKAAFITRLALAATLGSNYGMLAGYELLENEPLPGKEEYFDSEKYEIRPRDWNKQPNIKGFVRMLNAARAANPALQQFKNLRFHHAANEQVLFQQMVADGKNRVFVVVNLDPENRHDVNIEMPLYEMGIAPDASYRLDDLLGGDSWTWRGAQQKANLDPAINPVAIFRMSHD